GEVGVDQEGAGQIGAGQVGAGQNGVDQVGAGQIGVDQVCFRNVRTTQVDNTCSICAPSDHRKCCLNVGGGRLYGFVGGGRLNVFGAVSAGCAQRLKHWLIILLRRCVVHHALQHL